MRAKTILRLALLVAVAAGATAARAGENTHTDRFCPAPVAVCGIGLADCPHGFSCVCVPSCPDCDDCAAFVCAADAPPECDTACDCPASLGCFEGQCIAGFAPVFCCDEGSCPIGDQCQRRDGTMSVCDESVCEARREAVQSAIDSFIAGHNRCRRDFQCVWVPTRTDCEGTCGTAVRRKFRARMERRLGRLDRRVCSTYQRDGCPYIEYECVPPQPVCLEGRCVYG